MTGERTWLDVPYEQKDAAKAAGALWDWRARRWYAPHPSIAELAQWAPAPREAPEAADTQGQASPRRRSVPAPTTS